MVILCLASPSALAHLAGTQCHTKQIQFSGLKPILGRLLGGVRVCSAFIGSKGVFAEATPLLVQRLLAGVVSALMCIAEIELDYKTADWQEHPQTAHGGCPF